MVFGDRDARRADFFNDAEYVQHLGRFAAIGQQDHHVFLFDHPAVAVYRFGGMDEKCWRARTG
ncbi:hypothetical protein D3C74_395470 [compost metagenome]